MEWRPVSVTLLGPVVVSSSLLPGVRFSPAERRARLLRAYRVDLVVDLGANAGQYAGALRAAGYRGRIVSFEPLSEPYRRLAAASNDDGAWDCRRLALGRRPGAARVNVSEDTRNSSLLTVGARHLRAVPDSRTVRVESARAVLDAITLVEVELSLAAVYDAGPLFHEVVRFLDGHDFAPIAFEGVLDDMETGEMLQADAIFRRGT